MAPVPLEQEVRYTPLLLVLGHLTTIVYAIYTIAFSLIQARRNLGPSQDTRIRTLRRSKRLPTFITLALLSLSLAGYSGLRYATLSYQTWADERGLPSPHSPFGRALFSRSASGPTVYLAHWLNDTPIYADAYEILAEKARRFWWAQQLDLATVAWSMFLAIEGRRRRIPNLWAYPFLAQSVSLPFAQNLFHVALLLTPSPNPTVAPSTQSRWSRIASKAVLQKPEGWTPHPTLYLAFLLVNYVAVARLPTTAGTPSFGSSFVASKLLPVVPVFLPFLVPLSWGSVREHVHDDYHTYIELFRLVSLASGLINGENTWRAIRYNLPDAYKHRHSIRIPFDTVERSRWERTSSAISKVLGSTSDHPVVAAAGRDVLLSALSMGMWAATRAIDVSDMLRSTFPFYRFVEQIHLGKLIGGSDEHEESNLLDATSDGTLGRIGRTASPTHTSQTEDEVQAPRRRGRLRKNKSELEEVSGDATYQPTPAVEASVVEGDIVPEDDSLDWESASLSWGLSTLGGLGMGFGSVYGAECISR